MRTGWILEAVSVASLATLSAGRVARSNTNAVANDVEAGQNTARDSRAIAATSNYLTLRKRTRPTSRNSPESHKRDTPKDATPPPGYPFNAGLTNVKDAYYVADIKIGDETVAVSVDTGSSDTWLIKSPFTCVDYYQRNMPVRILTIPHNPMTPISVYLLRLKERQGATHRGLGTQGC